MEKSIVTIEEKIVYSNEYVTVYDNDVLFPSGKKGTYYRSRWKASFGVAVVVVDNLGDLILIEKYKYSDLRYSIEIPQGFGLKDEDPSAAARRELKEELNVEGGNWELLFTLSADFPIYVFRTNLLENQIIDIEKNEFSEPICRIHKITLNNKLFETIEQLQLFDLLSIAAIQKVALENVFLVK